MTTIDCQGALSLLMPYLDSELDAATTQVVNAHLLRCPACRRRYEAEQVLEAGLASLAGEAEPLPGAVAERVDRALTQARNAGRPDARDGSPPRRRPSSPAGATRSRTRRPPSARQAPGRPVRRWRLVAGLAAAAAVVLAVVLSTEDGGRPLPPRSVGPHLGQAMLALHRQDPTAADEVGSGALDQRLQRLLGELGVSGVALPGQGVVGGHPLRLVAARAVQLDDRRAVQLRYSCCDRPASVFIVPRDPVDEGQGRPLPVDDQGRPARLDDLHTWGLLRDDAYVGVLSDHDVSVLIPGLSS